MEEMNCFIINGSKKLIFRREGEKYVCFDPVTLEFYEVNEAGACILYLVSENQKYYHIIEILQDWFEIEKEELEMIVNEFLVEFPMKKLIISNLMEIGVPRLCLFK